MQPIPHRLHLSGTDPLSERRIVDRIGTDQITRYTFTLLWSWIAIRTALPWLVFFRLTFEGDSYSWGTSYFGHQFYSSGLGA